LSGTPKVGGLYAVWGTSPSDVFAVGSPAILHYGVETPTGSEQRAATGEQ